MFPKLRDLLFCKKCLPQVNVGTDCYCKPCPVFIRNTIIRNSTSVSFGRRSQPITANTADTKILHATTPDHQPWRSSPSLHHLGPPSWRWQYPSPTSAHIVSRCVKSHFKAFYKQKPVILSFVTGSGSSTTSIMLFIAVFITKSNDPPWL